MPELSLSERIEMWQDAISRIKVNLPTYMDAALNKPLVAKDEEEFSLYTWRALARLQGYNAQEYSALRKRWEEFAR